MTTKKDSLSITLHCDSQDQTIAALAALAIGIHVLESALPSPLPGVKPGFANIIIVITLILYGFKTAAWVAILRIIGGSLIIGSFLSPTFFLSLSGATASLFTITVLLNLPLIRPGVVLLSIFGAMAHISAQFWFAWWLIIPHPDLLKLFPILLTASFFMGTLSGLIALRLLKES
ncbi:Heptaprenyl diphosphate synthase component I [hydrothermal vent metagenome]|uniref:Heptaprenyl diphosphate synthase component I n=1 Tax=hydrothermal vent metagenome TaxID=652676 RepID=A0A3B0ZDZ0_9ZZZZ